MPSLSPTSRRRRPIPTFVWLLALAPLTASCSALGEAPLTPRHRALYTEVEFSPTVTAEGVQASSVELASLTRRRTSESLMLSDGSAQILIEFRGDRAADGAFLGEIKLQAFAQDAALDVDQIEATPIWEATHRLPPRTSGLWEFPLPGVAREAGWRSFRIEVEPDRYVEMDRVKPHRLPRSYGW